MVRRYQIATVDGSGIASEPGNWVMDKTTWILTGLVWGAVFALFFYFRWRYRNEDHEA